MPLKSRKISRNWRVTCDSLLATLKSIENQSDRNFSTIIVGHEKPEFLDHEYPDVHFEAVKFAPPNRSSPDFKHQNLVEDKNLKIATGIVKLSAIKKIDYWYQLDADDLLRHDFIATINSIEEAMGVVLDGGYLIYKSAKRFIPSSELSLHCGSTSIISDKIMNIPTTLEPADLQKIPWTSIAHSNMHSYFKRHCKDNYKVITTPLIAYTLSSGDNISDKWRGGFLNQIKSKLKPFILGKKLNNKLLKVFGQTMEDYK